MLNFTPENFDANLKKADELYHAKALPGVKFISYDIREFRGYKTMYFFTQPLEEQEFILYVGQAIVHKMKYLKQECNYSNAVYCSQLNTGLIYTVPYYGETYLIKK